VPEAVVDLLEVVQVNEEQRSRTVGAARRSQHPLCPVEHQCAVRKPGEGIVQCLVTQLLLEVTAVRDICDRADEARRRPRRAGDRQCTAVNPTVRTVAAPQAVLGLECAGPAVPAGVELCVECCPILGMHPLEPLIGACPDVVGFATDYGLPPIGEDDPSVEEIPVPQTVVGGTGGEGIALFAGAQRTDRALLLERHGEQGGALEVEVVARGNSCLEWAHKGQQAPVPGGRPDGENRCDLRRGRPGERDERRRREGLDPDVVADREGIAGVGNEGAGKLDGRVLAGALGALGGRLPPEPEVGGSHPGLAQERQPSLGVRRVPQQVQADVVFVAERVVEPPLFVLLFARVRPRQGE